MAAQDISNTAVGASAPLEGSPAAGKLPLQRYVVGLVYAILTIAALSPLFAVEVPPLVDLPNHLARLHIISGFEDSATLRDNYQVHWGVMPNLAMDLLLLPLAAMLPIELLSRLFVGGTMLLTIGGTLLLHRTLYGRLGFSALAVYIVLYNQVFAWGFLNNLFGLSMAMLAFAGWIALRDKPWRLRLPLFAGLTIVLFFSHLVALALYGILVGGYEFSREVDGLRRDWRPVVRNWLLGAAQFIPPTLLLVLTAPPPPETTIIAYGTVFDKFRAILSPFMMYIGTADTVILGFVLFVAVLAGLARQIRIARGMALPLAVLVLLAMAMPLWVNGRYGGIWAMDLRMMTFAAFIAVAALRLELESRPLAAGIAVLCVVVFGVRLTEIHTDWRIYDRQVREYRQAALLIEPGSSILQSQTMPEAPEAAPNDFGPAYWHLATYSVIDRDGFVPTIFTDPTKQPVGASAARAVIDTPFGNLPSTAELLAGADIALRGQTPKTDRDGTRLYWTDWPHRFDYVIALPGSGIPAGLAPLLEPKHAGSFFVIYRVIPGSCAGTGAPGGDTAAVQCRADAAPGSGGDNRELNG